MPDTYQLGIVALFFHQKLLKHIILIWKNKVYFFL